VIACGAEHERTDELGRVSEALCSGLTLTPSPASPQSVGTSVNLTASASCPPGTAEFRFLVRAGNGPYSEFRAWGASPNATWNTGGLTAGSYTLRVQVRTSGGSAVEVHTGIGYELGERCGPVSAVASPPSPEPPGSLVTITGNAACTGGASAEYRFLQRASGASAFTVFRDWAAGASAAWDTAGLGPGQYQIRIETRADDRAGPAQTYTTLSYALGGQCRSVSLSPKYVSPRPLGPFTLTAEAVCEDGSPEYRFLYLAPGASAYTEFRGWGGPAATLDLGGFASGVYTFRVYTRAIGSTVSHQATASGNQQFGSVCHRVTIAATPGSPQPAGATVNVTGSATCVGSAVPEYRFLFRRVGVSSWTVLAEWGGAAAAWNTSGLAEGSYQLRVHARGQGNLSNYESYRSASYTIGASSEPNWVAASPATPLGPRIGLAGAYDEARERVVIFGGLDFNETFDETWEWDGTNWIERNPTTRPSPRTQHAMAYDAARERVVLFGGFSGDYLADTWEWDGTNWIEQNPATSPPARIEHSIFYDAVSGRVLMFGGDDGVSRLGDTWAWDGTGWTELSPVTSPSPRGACPMTYDSARRRGVLFGGTGESDVILADTWEWDGTNWIERSPASSPSPRLVHGMAYDAPRGRSLLFGGAFTDGFSVVPFDDTWAWDGSDWVELFPAVSPSPRGRHLMAYDAARERILLFGGADAVEFLGGTWQWFVP
jgi:hypothetical protein